MDVPKIPLVSLSRLTFFDSPNPFQEEKEKIRKCLCRETRPAQEGDDLEDFPEEMLGLIACMDQENRDHFKGVVAQAAGILEKKAALEKKEDIRKAVASAVEAKVHSDEKKRQEQQDMEPNLDSRVEEPVEPNAPEPKASGLEAGPSHSNAGIPRPRDTRVATANTWKFLLPLSGAESGIYVLWKPEKRKFSAQFTAACSST